MKKFHRILLAVAFLSAASFAQEHPPEPAPASEAAAEAVAPGEPAAVAEPESAPKADSVAVAEPESTPDSVTVAEPQPAIAAEPQPAPEPVQQPVAQAAEAVVQKSEPLEISLKLGARLGLGVSNYRNHVALRTSDGAHALKLDPAFAFSAGAVLQIGFTKLFALSPELQYSLYRSNTELKVKSKREFDGLYDVGVYTHAFELPVLARFNFGVFYAEAGPQVGLNFSSRIYKDADYYRPDQNLLAFGVVGGGGVNLSGVLLGVRGYFGFLEYAEDAKGIPWSVQLSVSSFIF